MLLVRVLTTVLIALLVGWALNTRKRPIEEVPGVFVLRYAFSWRLIGNVAITAAIFCAVVLVWLAPQRRSPLCQCRVRQLLLETCVPMGGEWIRDRAQTIPCSWS